MQLVHIIGNDHVKMALQRMVQSQRIGHSLLFAGRDGIGKSLFAKSLAVHLLGGPAQSARVERETHPDLHVYRPEGKIAMHSIDTMRRFSDDVYMAANEAAYKVFIVHDADRMLSTSSNALLKTFEEPAPHTLIILLTSNPQALLTTVMSRCRKVFFQPLTSVQVSAYLIEKHGCAPDVAEQLAQQSFGSIGRALRLMQQQGDSRRTLLLDTLARVRLATYRELSQVVEELHDAFEKQKEELTAAVTNEIMPKGIEELTATQKDLLQKEIDGAVTLRLREELDALFEALLGWYRDLELLRCQADEQLLYHRDRLDHLRQALNVGVHSSVDAVQQAISDARISIQRSSSINSTLESLFLRLDLI